MYSAMKELENGQIGLLSGKVLDYRTKIENAGNVMLAFRSIVTIVVAIM